jgi:hypothetical protein
VATTIAASNRQRRIVPFRRRVKGNIKTKHSIVEWASLPIEGARRWGGALGGVRG